MCVWQLVSVLLRLVSKSHDLVRGYCVTPIIDPHLLAILILVIHNDGSSLALVPSQGTGRLFRRNYVVMFDS